MKPWWKIGPACALLLLAADAGPAHAAWDNVFQVTCFGCRKRAATSNYYAAPAPAVSYYAGSACCPPPPPTCTTRYVQRSYYQPVTTYQSRSYYQAVTTYRTSYYYEPVTSYRYSCYVDPCTGCSQQVACPQTSYRLRSQSCPVQSWVQRCCQVPVKSYRIASYWEPVTSCCQPAPTPCCPTAAAPPPSCPSGNCGQQPGVSVTPSAPPQPGVSEQRFVPQPGVNVTPSNNSPIYDRKYDRGTPPNNGTNRATRSITLPPPPRVRLDRIVSLPPSSLQGRVVKGGNDAPRANARIVFVSTGGARQQVTADAEGKFRVTLAAGGWLVYVDDSANRPAFLSRINLDDNEIRQVVLVSK